jgi:hypothetical protein
MSVEKNFLPHFNTGRFGYARLVGQVAFPGWGSQ